MPADQRNIFHDPEKDLYDDLKVVPVPVRQVESWIETCGRKLLKILQNLKSRIAVESLLEVFKNEVAAQNFIVGTPPGTIEAGEGLTEANALTTIKLLANAGFIKLTQADDFKKCEVVKFYAKMPNYRYGKFQL